MKTRKTLIIAALALVFAGIACAGLLKRRGFRATSTPSAFETVAARPIRDFAIPGAERHKTNPDAHDWTAVEQGREDFLARCASCHGVDARGRTPIGANVYPHVPDLRSDSTHLEAALLLQGW
jgi:mono/diheme cytochrome c family protein